MNPADLAEQCVSNINFATEHGLPMKQAQVMPTTPKGWKAPPKFPTGYLAQVKEDGTRIRSVSAMKLLAWLVANGFVQIASKELTK